MTPTFKGIQGQLVHALVQKLQKKAVHLAEELHLSKERAVLKVLLLFLFYKLEHLG